MSMFDLNGKVAVVTGATKGIGLGIAQALAAQGAKLVVGSRDGAVCEALAADLDRDYGKGGKIARGLAFDLDSLAQVESFASDAVKAWDGVDILVCNAAILPYIGPSAQTPPELFDRILTRNIHHNFRLCQAVRASMAARGGGSIVLIGSEAGRNTAPMVLAYAVAKAGISHMALCLADEMAGDGIRVNCVAPGLIRSAASTDTLGEAGFVAAAKAAPLGRVGEPQDIAGAVIYFSSAAGSHVTGETIIVDGGGGRLSPRSRVSYLEDASGKTYN